MLRGSFTAIKGETVTVEWQADDGYYVSKVYVNGKAISINENEMVLENIDEDTEIEVLFAKRATSSISSGKEPVVNTAVENHNEIYFTLLIFVFATIGVSGLLLKKKSAK